MGFRSVLIILFFTSFILNGFISRASDSLIASPKPILDTILYDTLKINKITFQNQDSDIFEVVHDSRLNDLLKKDIRININNENKMPGFRVQIYASRIRKKSDSEKSRFLSIYSSIKAHMIWEQPYFKVRIGDFKTRLEAQKAMDLISKDFSSCYIVRDEILIKKTRVKEK